MIPEKPSELVFFVNGHKVCDENVNPEWNLLYYLREKLRLCGTKLGCGDGGCGACTVMLSKYNRTTEHICNIAVNACLTPICSLHGCSVTTVEGIGSISKGLHPVQERITKCHGTQCGFCTPGMVMSMYTLLRSRTTQTSAPSLEDVQMVLQGNLCRCTGYRPIIESFKTLTQEGCCVGMVNGKCCQEKDSTEKKEDIQELYSPTDFKPYDATQDPIFPPELISRSDYDEEFLLFKGERVSWYRPVSMESLTELKSKFPHATLVAGNTKLGIQMKEKLFPVLIQLTQVNVLLGIKVEESGIRFGSSVALAEIGKVLQSEMDTQAEFKTRIFAAIIEMLKWFGGTQIRNAATVGGVISSKSGCTSDLIPIFMASRCQLLLQNGDDSRTVVMDKTFYDANHQSIIQSSEIIVSILIPFSQKESYCFGFKQARRRDCDTAIVNAGMFIQFQTIENKVIEDVQFAVGGIAPSTMMAHQTTALLIGKSWDENIVSEVTEILQKNLALLCSSNETVDLKISLVLSFLYKFYLLVSRRLGNQIPANLKSAMDIHQRIAPKGFQLFESVLPEHPNWDALRRPLPHLSAFKHATGESVFVDDMPKFENEVYLALVVSSKANAKIISIDPEDALREKGVVDFISAKDIPTGRNWKDADEEIFASERVTCVGQVIGSIVAIDKPTAQRAAKLVKIEYEEISPLILTIQDAIASNSFYNDWTKYLNKGDVEKGFEESDEILEGEMNVGGQEHFYLETHCSIALPKLEDGEMEIFTSSQQPASIQNYVARVLGVPQNRIVVRVKRIGGGFGGKESQASIVAVPVAIAAQKLRRPVRCMLDRDEDMAITGGRHPFFCKYKVGFKTDGKVIALKLEMYNNGGNSVDLSPFVMESAMLNCDNAYKIENMNITGIVCETNIPSNTAFRGFGNPQVMIICESIFEHIAQKLEMDPVQFRELNMYSEGDKTHYNQVLENCTLRRCWDECLKNSEYNKRREEIRMFNEKNRWRKRGLSIIPTKFGLSFVPAFLNQGAAFINVYRDGSVLLSHGGTEMGQGLYTKMIQVASRTLGISADKIHTLETSSSTIPNTSPTAASTGSDLNGMAVLNACNTLMERLKPIMEANPDGKWGEWIDSAYMDRISLSATGFYSMPCISGYDMTTGKGTPFRYFSYGAACSEVEIDCLTGNHVVKRTDIVMDVGESLNPAIDVGQIEGAFAQGYGLFTLEELRLSPEGKLLTNGPSTYKIPTLGDIPSEFNVSLLRGAPNPKAVYSSKGVGEPPLFLAASVFFAIKQAVTDARNENKLQGPFPFDSPATVEKIHMLCKNNSKENSGTQLGAIN